MEAEPQAAPEAAPALEHDVVIEEGEHTKYPAPLASHQQVLEDKELFLALLQDLCTKLQDAEPKQWRPTKFRVPTAAGQDLDLQRLYRCTTELGGAVAVTEQARWPEVIKPMNFPSKVNTAAIRKIYSQLLWHFEEIYFNGAAGQPLNEPPELAAATAAAAAVHAAAVDRQPGGGSGFTPNGGSRARPARSRKGPSLAALIAAEDQISSGLEEGDAAAADGYDGHSGDEAGSGDDGDHHHIAAPGATPAGSAEPVGVRKPAAAALLLGGSAAPTGSPLRGSAPPPAAAAADSAPAAAAAAANGSAPPPPAASKPRSRPSQPRSSVVAAPGKTPELTAFMKSGRHRRDLTGAPVSGKVEARFDCGYFVSITVGGLQFGGVLYCPTGTGTAAAGAGQGQQASRGAGVKREESGTEVAGGSGRKPPAGGSSVKREAGAAGLEEGGGGGGGGGSRPVKRRRSARDPNDPTLANKPKSAKTAFNFFAAEQWAAMRGELGANAAPQDISRLIGERWNKKADGERAPYVAKALEDKTRFEREMDTWRSGLEATAAAAGAQDSAAVDGAGGAAAAGVGSQGDGDAMEVDAPAQAAAVAAVKQEQRSATPPRPHQPKIKLKMSAGRQHTPPPAAAAAAAAAGGEAGGMDADGGAGFGGSSRFHHQQQQQYQPQAASDAGGAGMAPASPVLPAAEPFEQQRQLQPQPYLDALPGALAAATAAAAAAVAAHDAALGAVGIDSHAAAAATALPVLDGSGGAVEGMAVGEPPAADVGAGFGGGMQQ